jgi:hypothetical protein
VDHHENGSREITREFTGQEAQRLEPAGGGTNGQDVAISHAMLHEGKDEEPAPGSLVPKIPVKSNLSDEPVIGLVRYRFRPDGVLGLRDG